MYNKRGPEYLRKFMINKSCFHKAFLRFRNVLPKTNIKHIEISAKIVLRQKRYVSVSYRRVRKDHARFSVLLILIMIQIKIHNSSVRAYN